MTWCFTFRIFALLWRLWEEWND